MWSCAEHVDVMAEPEEALHIVGDLMTRGHYWPEGIMAIRETAPRPFSPTEKFLPGQRIAFLQDGAQCEHAITEVVEWDQAEAHVLERPLRSQKDESIAWRLSELIPGTIRVTATYNANLNAIERLSKGKSIRAFYAATLQRMKKYIEDKRSFAGPRTYAPKPSSADPLSP
jgi:hypothetical protein